MRRIDTEFPGVFILEPRVHTDKRGFFYETWNRRTFADRGIDAAFVQDNHSCSSRGVLRGLHYQLEQPQAKLVRVVRGKIYDVVVDVRRGSPTFGRWLGATLSAKNRLQLFIPEGFAHGYYTISEVAEVLYKCTDFYLPQGERGIIWNDPELGIDWPIGDSEPIVSEKDLRATWLSKTDPADLPVFQP